MDSNTVCPRGFQPGLCFLKLPRPHPRLNEPESFGLGPERVARLSLLCHWSSVSSEKEPPVPQNDNSIRMRSKGKRGDIC